mmetsp:Transcript_11363/g.20924  ORF Transcript_11363/g.20924 Transcript_11363/m.20924 type:complete len:907 (+) Transcript_11363:51-2771(+)
MFGVPRKKSRPTKLRPTASSSNDDEESDDDAHRRIQQHRRKKKGKSEKKKKTITTMLSFDPEEGGNDEDEPLPQKQKKSKKRKKHSKHGKKSGGGSLGYGGLGVMPMNASDGSSSEGERKKTEENEDDTNRGGNYYDTGALEKLRLEQKRSTFVKDDTITAEPASVANAISGEAKDDKEENTEEEYISLSGGRNNKTSSRVVEEEFISLSGGSRSNKASSRVYVDPVVLTGDDAMAYAQREEDDGMNLEFDHGLMSPPTPPSGGVATEKAVTGKIAGMDMNADSMDIDDDPSEEVEEGNRRWEDTMARRAGVLPPKAATATVDHKSGRSPQQQRGNNSSSLSQIRTSLQPTISNLENIYSDLETSIHRHESTLSSTRDDLTKHQSTLKKHGQALEYYQGLREDLATWMGALRELNGMVDKVEEAKRQLEAEISWRRMERFLEWGKDCAEVLEKQGLLETKVVGEGRPNEANRNDAPVQVDEFGRDLSSMASIARVKRCNQRGERSLERVQDSQVDNGDLENSLWQRVGCSNEDNFGSDEIGEWRQRHEALAQAITIIPNLVKDDYLSISNLCSLFFDWGRLYPGDYASCFAEMSLIQMVTVLVRLEMCEQWDVLNLVQSSSTICLDISGFKWFHDLKKRILQSDANNGEVDKTTSKTGPRKGILLEVVQKQIVSRLLDSFLFEDGSKNSSKQHGIYDPFSVPQTKRLCSMFKSILGYFSNCSEENGKVICEETVEKVLHALFSSVKYYVGRMSVPIADASKITMTRNEFAIKDGSKGFDGETADAIAYASVIQAKELCTLVKNILGQWYPIINQEMHSHQQDQLSSLVQFVFVDLVSIRILPILHSLHDITSGSNDNDKKFSEMPKLFINDILGAMQGADLLQKDEWMLMAAPLRVVAKQWNDNGS